MNSNTGTTAIDELRENAARLRDDLPMDVFPVEPPNNERNSYWKWCPVCGFEFLFPGNDRDPRTIHCEGCGGGSHVERTEGHSGDVGNGTSGIYSPVGTSAHQERHPEEISFKQLFHGVRPL